MAILNIVEFHGRGPVRDGNRVPLRGAGLNPQDVAAGAGSTNSTAFAAGTVEIRLCPDIDVRIKWNDDATATSERLPAGAIEYRASKAGDFVAVIAE